MGIQLSEITREVIATAARAVLHDILSSQALPHARQDLLVLLAGPCAAALLGSPRYSSMRGGRWWVLRCMAAREASHSRPAIDEDVADAIGQAYTMADGDHSHTMTVLANAVADIETLVLEAGTAARIRAMASQMLVRRK